jgi:hypothetical protein
MKVSGAFVLVLVAALTGCGGQAVDVARPAPPDATLVVESGYPPGPKGVLYSEGALVEVVLVDEAGDQMTARGPVEEELVFDGLAPGRYVVRPALRPCIANCDNLAERTGECEGVVQVPATTRVRVDHVVSETCTATPVP